MSGGEHGGFSLQSAFITLVEQMACTQPASKPDMLLLAKWLKNAAFCEVAVHVVLDSMRYVRLHW